MIYKIHKIQLLECPVEFLQYYVYFLCIIVDDKKYLTTCQVSHHPMVVACHCEGTGWRFWADSNLKSKFWGRSIQLDPVGALTLEFDDGEVFQWSKVPLYN